MSFSFKRKGQVSPFGFSRFSLLWCHVTLPVPRHDYKSQFSDTTTTLTIKGCVDATCSSPTSTYTMPAATSTVGYCYAGGSNVIYFDTGKFDNVASPFSLAGKTITDLGTVTTADINGGTIDGVTFTGGTIDFSSTGTLNLRAGQLGASVITSGTFTSGGLGGKLWRRFSDYQFSFLLSIVGSCLA